MSLDCFVSGVGSEGYVGCVSVTLDCFVSGVWSEGYVGPPNTNRCQGDHHECSQTATSQQLAVTTVIF